MIIVRIADWVVCKLPFLEGFGFLAVYMVKNSYCMLTFDNWLRRRNLDHQ